MQYSGFYLLSLQFEHSSRQSTRQFRLQKSFFSLSSQLTQYRKKWGLNLIFKSSKNNNVLQEWRIEKKLLKIVPLHRSVPFYSLVEKGTILAGLLEQEHWERQTIPYACFLLIMKLMWNIKQASCYVPFKKYKNNRYKTATIEPSLPLTFSTVWPEVTIHFLSYSGFSPL